MPRNGTKAAAVDPDSVYDNLSQDEQDTFDRIALSGLKPVPSGRGWAVESANGGEKIGPFPDLATLEEAVSQNGTANKDAIDAEPVDGDRFELTGEAPEPPKTHHVGRQSLLPGTENAVLQDLRNAILGYRATTMEILDAQARQKDEKRLVVALMHKFEDELTTDRETGNKFYQVETVRAVLEITEKEELKTEKVELP